MIKLFMKGGAILIKDIIIDAISRDKQVAFRYDRGNNFVADTLVDAIPDEPNWIHVRHTHSSNSRLINLNTIQRIVIED